MLVTKQQVSKYVTLSENISDLDVDMFIREADEFDTISVFPTALINAIKANLITKIQQWNKNKSYSENDIVIFNTYFTAKNDNSDSQPPSNDWKDNELMNFYLEYLVPFISYSFYYRFIAYHGAKITQAGIIQTIGDTFQPVTDKHRGEMLGDIKNKINICAAKANKKMNDVRFIFDGIHYPLDSCKKGVKANVKIYALGERNYERHRFHRFGRNY